MWKKTIIAIVAVFIAWTFIDYIVNTYMLADEYQATAALWRAPGEIKSALMMVVTFLAAIGFVGIYACLINPKTLGRGLRYGAIYGFGIGVPMAYGPYAYMPIPYSLALGWFVATFIEVLIGGLIVGLIVREEKA